MSGTGSFTCPVAQTRLYIPRPLITQSGSTEGNTEIFSLARTRRKGRWPAVLIPKVEEAHCCQPECIPLSRLHMIPRPPRVLLIAFTEFCPGTEGCPGNCHQGIPASAHSLRTHTYVRAYIRTHLHMYIHTYLHTYMYSYIHPLLYRSSLYI